MSTDELTSQAEKELRDRAQAICDKLNEIADLQEEVKQLKGEAKALGYDMKAFGQIVRELRRGADYRAAQLELELVVDTYRKAVGLPVNLEAAQEAAREEAEQLPGGAGEKPTLDERIDRRLDDAVKAGKMTKIGPRTYEMAAGRDGTKTTLEVRP